MESMRYYYSTFKRVADIVARAYKESLSVGTSAREVFHERLRTHPNFASIGEHDMEDVQMAMDRGEIRAWAALSGYLLLHPIRTFRAKMACRAYAPEWT